MYRVGGVVVAKAGGLVEADHPNAAAPRTVGHPQHAVLVVEHAGVDAVGEVTAPLVAAVVAGGQTALCADDHLKVGILVTDGVEVRHVETADDDRGLVAIGTGDLVAGQQDDAGVPFRAVDAQVHAPFLHLLVPYHVGGPHVAVDVVAFTIGGRPGQGVEVGKGGLLAVDGHRADFLGGEGETVHRIVARGIGPRHGDAVPVHQVFRHGGCAVAAEDVPCLGVGLPHDGGVVHGDAFHADVALAHR